MATKAKTTTVKKTAKKVGVKKKTRPKTARSTVWAKSISRQPLEDNFKGKRERNEVVRPRRGFALRVFQIADAITAKANRKAYLSEVLIQAAKEKIKEGTTRQQYHYWRTFHGIKGRYVLPLDQNPVRL